jgi:hypothetical protein
MIVRNSACIEGHGKVPAERSKVLFGCFSRTSWRYRPGGEPGGGGARRRITGLPWTITTGLYATPRELEHVVVADSMEDTF